MADLTAESLPGHRHSLNTSLIVAVISVIMTLASGWVKDRLTQQADASTQTTTQRDLDRRVSAVESTAVTREEQKSALAGINTRLDDIRSDLRDIKKELSDGRSQK